MYIKAKVRPNSKKDQIIELKPNYYEIHLKAKPERNQANISLIDFLNTYFENPPGGVKIINGHHTRVKLIRIGKD